MRTWRWYAVRIEIAAGIAAAAVLAFLIVSEPNTMGGDGRRMLDSRLTWVDIGGIAIGLVAMIRIFRQAPEDGSSSWRAFRR